MLGRSKEWEKENEEQNEGIGEKKRRIEGDNTFGSSFALHSSTLMSKMFSRDLLRITIVIIIANVRGKRGRIYCNGTEKCTQLERTKEWRDVCTVSSTGNKGHCLVVNERDVKDLHKKCTEHSWTRGILENQLWTLPINCHHLV